MSVEGFNLLRGGSRINCRKSEIISVKFDKDITLEDRAKFLKKLRDSLRKGTGRVIMQESDLIKIRRI